MSEQNPNPTRPVSSFLPSPRFFNTLFSPKTLVETESSPTSILETNFNSVNDPFEINKSRTKPKKLFNTNENPCEKYDHEGIALALIDDQPHDDQTIYKPSKINRKILFASNLKIQIPDINNNSSDYGIKTRSLVSTPTGYGSPRSCFSGPLSLKEMELTEEYTRVVSHGPNPKTIHIYDDCVVESCCGLPELKKPGPKPSCDGFLSFCYACNRSLGEDDNIFIYRGEKAFCSEECRCQEMVLDGLMMNS